MCHLCLRTGREFTAKRPYVVTALSRAIIVGGVLLAYPLLFALVGPAHVHGVPQLAGGPGDLLGVLVPGFYQWINPRSTRDIWTQFEPYFYSASLYLGIPLVLTVSAIVIWLRRRAFVVFAGAMMAIALILSLGSFLYFDHVDTHFPLPFIVLAHVPIVDGLIATRFSLFTDLFGAGLLAIGVNEVYVRVKRSISMKRLFSGWGSVIAAGAACAVAAIALVPLVPSRTQPSLPTRVPTLFTAGSASPIPAGSVVLAYPYPSALVHTLHGASSIFYPFVNSVDDIMLDQAVSGMRFKIVGGYGWTPSKVTERMANPSSLTPNSVETLFDASFYGTATPAQEAQLAGSKFTADLRLFLHRYHIGSAIVLPLGQRPATVISRITAAIGPPSRSNGVTGWFDVQQRLAGLPANARS